MSIEDPIVTDLDYQDRLSDLITILAGVLAANKAVLELPGKYPLGTIPELVRQIREIAKKDGSNPEPFETLVTVLLTIVHAQKARHGGDILEALQQMRAYAASRNPKEFPAYQDPSEEEDPGEDQGGPLLN